MSKVHQRFFKIDPIVWGKPPLDLGKTLCINNTGGE